MAKATKVSSQSTSVSKNGYSADQFLKTLIENAPNAIFAVSYDGTFVEMNSLAAKALGGAPADFIGKRMNDLFPTEHAARQLESIRRVISSKKGEVHRRQTEVGGDLRWFVTTIQPLPGGNGEVDVALLVSNDISDTIENSQELQRERDFTSTILQSANCLIFALDHFARITVFNAECEKLSGYNASEVIGKDYHSIFLPQEAHHDGLKDFGDWVRQNPKDSYEGPWRTKSGEVRIIYWSTSAFEVEETGELVAIAVGVDVTDRKKTEEELRLHAFAFENITDAVMIIDTSGKIVQWNAGAENMLGYKAEEVIGTRPDLLVASDVAEDLNKEIREQLNSGNRWNGVIKGNRKDGSAIYSETSIIPLIDASGERLAIVSVSHDITPHRDLEVALRTAEAEKTAILQALPDMVFVLDYDGVCLDFKGAPDEEPIAPPEEFIGKIAHSVLPPETGRRVLEKIRLTLDTGMPQRLEYELDLPHTKGYYEVRFAKSETNSCVAVVRNMTQRKAMESQLADTALKLKLEHQQVLDTNVALREVLQHVESECNKIKSQVVENVDKQVAPLLEKLRHMCDTRQGTVVAQIEKELNDIISPFTQNLRNVAGNLTRRELQIARLIRTGLHSKEIAELLDVSPRTVEKTRQNIRKKLGITNSDVNLPNYLDSILEPRT